MTGNSRGSTEIQGRSWRETAQNQNALWKGRQSGLVPLSRYLLIVESGVQMACVYRFGKVARRLRQVQNALEEYGCGIAEFECEPLRLSRQIGYRCCQIESEEAWSGEI